MARVFTYRQLEGLWQQAGGGAHVAPVMAAIAEAESGGRLNAQHKDANGSIDYGLWQINSVHGYNKQKLLDDPLYNAKAAVAVFHSQGFGAWSTYNNGSYKNYLSGANVTSTGSSWGVIGGSNAGVDQGVDFTGKGRIPALDQGTVTAVGTTSVIEGGTYPYLVYRLTNGPYKGHFVYVMESFKPDVHTGQNVRKGQTIGRATGNGIGIEIGFNQSAKVLNPVAPLYPDPHGPKPAGQQMLKYIQSVTGSGGGGGSTLGSITGDVFNFANSAATGGPVAAAGSLAGDIGGGLPSLIPKSVSDFFDDLTSASFWIRAGEVIGGGLLILLGLYLLTKQVGLAPGPTEIVEKTPLGATARAARKTPAPRPRPAPTRRVVRQYYLDENPAATRRAQLAAKGAARESDDVPF